MTPKKIDDNPSRRRRRKAQAGTTLLELMIAIAVVTVAAFMFSSTMVATNQQRRINRENVIAGDAVRTQVERMRNELLARTFPLFNEDPTDDPGGNGTAPGHRFEVEGLEPLATSPDGLAGEVSFPTMLPEAKKEHGQGEGAEKGKAAVEDAPLVPQLREDLVDAQLGMPRDLNGDSIIDSEDHAQDYLRLPIRVRIDWQGHLGPRHLECFTMLTEMRR